MEQYIIKEEECSDTVLIFIPNFLNKIMKNKLEEELKEINDWKVTKKFNKDVIQRKQKWYQVDNKPFGKNWKCQYEQWKSHNYTENLLFLQEYVQSFVNTKLVDLHYNNNVNFNSILINYYESGSNCIVPHKDDKNSFGVEPIIGLLSIGGTRKFLLERTLIDRMKRDKEKSFLNKEFELTDNSLLIMAGSSQRLYCHSIKEEVENTKGRFSLSFREFI